MISPPKGHSLVLTEDGSHTFYSEAFQEACHSTAGAREETLLHYIGGCQIADKAKVFSPLRILEVGFGLGIGFLTTLDFLTENQDCHFISMELDKELLEWFRINHPELNLQWNENLLEGQIGNFKLTIIHGDARKEVPRYLESFPQIFHAIYQDAFSPKKNPALWTKEWFLLLKKFSHPEVILSTYSASNSIRKSLHEAGWGVQKGEKFGPKRTSTRAVLNKETDPEVLETMNRSPVLAITDKDLK